MPPTIVACGLRFLTSGHAKAIRAAHARKNSTK
jgi:hypothetical protein